VSTQDGQRASALQEVSTALIRLHKEQFGRGPTIARTFFAGPDALVCVLEDALLPAERKLIALGNADQVRETRMAYQVATEDEFIGAVQDLIGRKVHSFASALDTRTGVVFENFTLEPNRSG
jgi:uncharacterized protein YbcI